MLTQEDLKKLIRYDPETGLFTRLAEHGNRCAQRERVIENSRASPETYPRTFLNGKQRMLSKLAWLYSYGAWPVKGILHLDGDITNNRLNNLREAMTQVRREILTLERLKELLYYDPDTGIFTYLTGRRAGQDLSRIGDKDGYLRTHIDKKTYKQHRLAWFYVYGVLPEKQVDHINHDVTDNRIENLREADEFGNSQNQIRAHRSNKSTGVLGVSYLPKINKFNARIIVNRKHISLGWFDTVEEAHEAYLKAKRELHSTCTL